MPMVDTALYADQLAVMSAAGHAFDRASEALGRAEENEDAAACKAAHAAIRDAREAWQAAAQEVGGRVHM